MLIGWVEEVGLSTEFSCSLWLKTVIYEVEGVNLNLLLSFCEISQIKVQGAELHECCSCSAYTGIVPESRN